MAQLQLKSNICTCGSRNRFFLCCNSWIAKVHRLHRGSTALQLTVGVTHQGAPINSYSGNEYTYNFLPRSSFAPHSLFHMIQTAEARRLHRGSTALQLRVPHQGARTNSYLGNEHTYNFLLHSSFAPHSLFSQTDPPDDPDSRSTPTSPRIHSPSAHRLQWPIKAPL